MNDMIFSFSLALYPCGHSTRIKHMMNRQERNKAIKSEKKMLMLSQETRERENEEKNDYDVVFSFFLVFQYRVDHLYYGITH